MKQVLVGMSGGVDSAVTVHLLQEQGYKVKALFLEMLDDSDFQRANLLAKQLGVELVRKNIKNVFREDVVKRFVSDYKNGITPNPCVMCNPQIKFKYLLQFANELGIEKVATGHYALLDRPSFAEIGRVVLKKARDEKKDQSYFLYRLTQGDLKKILFPLGDFRKEEVKDIAYKMKLKIPSSESQDVCFLKGGSLREYLRGNLTEIDLQKGDIIDEKGSVVGRHQGLPLYTIGQRQGLNIGGSGPFYVVRKNKKKNTLVVSRNKKCLDKREIGFRDVNWINTLPDENKLYQIKTRYQMKSVLARIRNMGDGKWVALAEDDVWALANGQSLVVYDNEVVVGGGIIY